MIKNILPFFKGSWPFSVENGLRYRSPGTSLNETRLLFRKPPSWENKYEVYGKVKNFDARIYTMLH